MKPQARIEFEKDLDKTRWNLPVRDISRYSSLGWLVIGVGGFIFLFSATWIGFPLFFGIEMIAQKEWFGILLIAFASVGLIGVLFGIRLFVLGFKLIGNWTQCHIYISRDRLYSVEELGWFDWKRKVKLDDILELKLKDSSQLKSNQNDDSDSFPGEMIALVAQCEKKEFLISVGYSEELTLQLAEHLSAEIGKSLHHQVKGHSVHQLTDKSPIRNVPVSKEAVEEVSIPTLPKNSPIVVHDKGSDSKAYEFPPAGLNKGSRGLFFFACLWLGMCTLFGLGVLFSDTDDLFFALLFVGLFVAGGMVMMLFAIDLGKRSVMIGVLGDQLFVERKSIYGKKWMEFDRSQIREISVENSGMAVNDVPIRELKIHTSDPKPTGLLSQYDDEELEWLAYQLSQDLEIPYGDKRVKRTWKSELAGLAVGRSSLPATSKIQVFEEGQGVDIKIPGRKSLSSVIATAFFALCILAAVVVGLVAIDEWMIAVLFSCAGLLFLVILATILVFSLRRYEISANRNRLSIRRIGVFRSRQFEWNPKGIERIEMAFSGWSSGETKYYQLQIIGKPESLIMLTWWTNREIAVVAGIMNKAVGLDANAELQGEFS